MQMRPVDIARKLNISTTTLRHYEENGMIPPVERSQSGYRIFTAEHIAYFICIREMKHGFSLSEIANMLKPVMAHQIDEVLWMANQAQVSLRNDKYICENIRTRLLGRKKPGVELQEISLDTVSKSTGIIPSTIRYWDNIGLISASRCTTNNYRKFTQHNMDEILIIQALKLAMRARGEKYAVEHIRKEMQHFDFADTDQIAAIVASIDKHLTILNRAQIRSISALYSLCTQVEEGRYEAW